MLTLRRFAAALVGCASSPLIAAAAAPATSAVSAPQRPATSPATSAATRPTSGPASPATAVERRRFGDAAPGRALMLDGGRMILVMKGPELPLYRRWGARPAELMVVDATTGKVLRRAAVADAAVRGAASAPDGRHAVVFGDFPDRADRRPVPAPYLAVWDLAEGRELIRFGEEHDISVVAAAISADNARVLTSNQSQPLRLWDVRRGEQIRALEVGKNVQCVALSPDGRRALLGGGWGDEGVYLWDVELNQQVKLMAGHHGAVTAVAFSAADEGLALSASLDGTVRLWRLGDGREVRRASAGEWPIVSMSQSRDGRRVAAVLTSSDNFDELYAQSLPGPYVRAWDLATMTDLGWYSGQGADLSATISEDGGSILVAGVNRLFRWTLPSTAPAGGATSPPLDEAPAQSAVADAPDPQRFAIRTDEIHHVGFLADGVAFSCGERNVVRRWDVSRGTALAEHAPQGHGVSPDVRSVSPDGRFAASCSSTEGNAAWLWELQGGRIVTTAIVENQSVMSATISPDGTLMAVGVAPRRGAEAPTEIRFYRTSDGSHAGSVAIAGLSPDRVTFAPDGNTIAVAGPNQIAVFELDTARRVRDYAPLDGEPVCIAYARDGSSLMAATRSHIYVWDARAGGAKLLSHTPVRGRIASADISPDGRRVITGGWDSNVRLFDVATRKQLARFDHHLYAPRAVAFAPDGRTAISGSHDKTLRVWRLPE